MSKYVTKVTHKLDLSDKLEGIKNREVRRQTLEEVGQYLVEQILENCGRSKSSVAGGSWKGSLSPQYKKRKEKMSSSTSPNMELTGDMLDALDFKISGNTVEVGIFDYDEAQKADNHNKFSSASRETKVPQRQFIPNNDEDETFRRDIIREINQIIEEARDGED
jgi:hypothetical protein